MSGGLVVSPSEVDFGAIPVGATQFRDITVANNNSATVEVEITTSLPFNVASSSPRRFSLGPQQSRTIRLTFTPTSPGTFEGPAVVTSPGDSDSVTLMGTGT